MPDNERLKSLAAIWCPGGSTKVVKEGGLKCEEPNEVIIDKTDQLRIRRIGVVALLLFVICLRLFFFVRTKFMRRTRKVPVEMSVDLTALKKKTMRRRVR